MLKDKIIRPVDYSVDTEHVAGEWHEFQDEKGHGQYRKESENWPIIFIASFVISILFVLSVGALIGIILARWI